MIIAKTNIYDKFQTVIPKRIKEELGITKKNTVIEWNINKKGKVKLTFRKKINWWWHDKDNKKKQML